MPRKRATRIKITQPPSDPIPVAEDVSIAHKNEQLSIFLQEYDCKVKNVLYEMEKKKTAIITLITTRFEQISQLNAKVAHMTLKEFADAGGTVESVRPMKRTSKLQMIDELKCAEAMKSLKTEESGLGIINEEDSEESVVLAKTLTAKTKNKSKKVAPSRLTRSKQTTPCSTTIRSVWGQTPLITPKFNPFLPLTPENERDIKPGERLMSLAGSPVRPFGKTPKLTVCQQVNKNDFAEELSNMGIDLTPGRAEKILELVSTKLAGK
ncbi:hypothetical protein Btru_028806 [Bulinus truncatus]|nr:hypothetical protein Btru_028806 [Bulinus truncatus]